MAPDHRILLRHGGTEVLVQAWPVTWPDGTALALHPVRLNGLDSLFHRALQLHDGTWIVFDVRKLWRALDEELRLMPARDVPGVVRYTLQFTFGTAEAVCKIASENAVMHWLPLPIAEAA